MSLALDAEPDGAARTMPDDEVAPAYDGVLYDPRAGIHAAIALGAEHWGLGVGFGAPF